MKSGLINRRSLRFQEYDYSQPGAYFVTICVQGWECLFGDIIDGAMRLNDAGRMVKKWWTELERKFPTIKTEALVIMPNHVHAVLVIVGADLCVCPGIHPDLTSLGTPIGTGAHLGAPLPKIMQWFKTMTTNAYIKGVKQLGWVPFGIRLWQRSFYEHVIRDDESLNRIREYIVTNPLRWYLDRENPKAQGKDDFDRWLATFRQRP